MDTILETPMRKSKLEEKVTPEVKGEADRKAIHHFLDFVHGHDSTIESWLNQAGLATYQDLLIVACDLEFLKSELLNRFENENQAQVQLTTVQRARIMAYFKALQAEAVDTAEASMGVAPSHLESAMKGAVQASHAKMASPSLPAPTSQAKSFGQSIKKDVSQYKSLDKDSKFILWHSQFVGNLKMHEVFDIIDPNVPEDKLAKDYLVKREFVFHVFSHVLDTPRSSKFLVTYHVDRDPRKLYQDLLHE